jgi:Bacterial transglutaminase-like cysteine proteinase BTLCP
MGTTVHRWHLAVMNAGVGALLARLRIGLSRVSWWFRRRESPWERVIMPVPPGAFGPGSDRDFGDYFDGRSLVPITSVDDIVEWLQTCEYVTDADQFNERDRWQHPECFEQVHRGDCEDFALWAWRKLVEIGIEAEFYVGRVACGETAAVRQHAWVVYRVDSVDYLFEPAARGRHRMIRPLSQASGDYVPHFAVNHRLQTSAFLGCVLDSYRG